MKLITSAALALLALGCATTQPSPEESLRLSYDADQIGCIMHMREAGEGLADVAAVVGGTRRTVRSAERQELARLREIRRSGGRPPVVSGCVSRPPRPPAGPALASK